MEELPTDSKTVVAAPAETNLEELSDQQKVYQLTLNQVVRFSKKVNEYKGSKKQLQKVLNYIALSKLTTEDPEFSYPEEKEVYELFDGIISNKFTLFLLSLEQAGKIKVVNENENGEGTLNEKEQVSNQLEPESVGLQSQVSETSIKS